MLTDEEKLKILEQEMNRRGSENYRAVVSAMSDEDLILEKAKVKP